VIIYEANMINFTSIPTEELKNKIAQFNKYCLERDPITKRSITKPCKFIFEDKQGNKTTSAQLYNTDTFEELRTKARRRKNVLCPITKKKIVDKENDLEGLKLIEEIHSTLENAIFSEDTDQIKAWLAAGGSPNQSVLTAGKPNPDFVMAPSLLPLLFIACDVKSHTIITFLIENGANINQFREMEDEFRGGESALFLSTVKKDTDIMELLIKNGANVNQLQGGGQHKGVSALGIAAFFGAMPIVESLIKNGANVNQLQEGTEGLWQGTSILYVTACRGLTNVAGLLIEKGANVNYKVGGRESVLFRAVSNGYPAFVELLIKHGADIFDFDLATIIYSNNNPSWNRKVNSDNHAAVAIINRERQKVVVITDYIAKTILAKKLDIMTPAQAMTLSLSDLINKLSKHMASILTINRNSNEISSKIAETDLSDEGISTAIKELSLPVVAPPGAPILNLANRKREASPCPEADKIEAKRNKK